MESNVNTAKNTVAFENLETRTMMAATPVVALTISELTVNGGTELKIVGSTKNDNITITRNETGLVVSNNGNWTRTYTGTYRDLLVNANAGNDKITVDSSVTDKTLLYGYTGNDTISGGAGSDRIYDGAGNDVVYGNDGDDIIVSVGGGTADKLTGGNGFDSFWRDSASTEKLMDLSADEAAGGNDHRIASFVDGKVTVSKELSGQRLADPTKASGFVYSKFADRPLFSSNGPTADDVKQGQTGDCYFLATLASIASHNQNVIEQSVVDLGDGTYGVQFAKSNGTKTFVRVDNDLATYTWNKSLPAYANLGNEGSMWVAIIEKAFTYFRKGSGTYASISSGLMSEAFTAMGKPASSTWTALNSDDLISKIENLLSQNQSVTAACFTSPAGSNMVTSHAYTVDHVVTNEDGTKSVVVRNPWGVDNSTSNDGANDGYVTLTAAQAFAALTYLTSAAV
jgi:hypothetical protein